MDGLPGDSYMLPATEIPMEMVPVSGSNPYYPYVSAPRQAMYTGQRTQELSVIGRTRKRQRSALEKELGKSTFRHQFDVDARVLAVIPRFRNDGVHGNFKINPLDVVIFEHYETGMLDVLELSKFHVMHQHYGFRYVANDDVMEKLMSARNPMFEKDTVVMRSPNITPDGDHMPGLETSLCLITDPAVTEDAMVYSDEYADERIRTTGYETRIFSVGRTHYPVNTYGTPSEVLILPNVGDRIHSNGLLCAMRPYDTILDAIYMSGKRLLKPVYGMDTTIYGVPDAVVVDIKVIRNESLRDRRLPEALTKQLDRYHQADKLFYSEIIRAALKRSGKNMTMKPVLSLALNSLLYDAFAFVGRDLVDEDLWPYDTMGPLDATRRYRGESLDEYRVEVMYEFLAKVKEGSKGTGLHGNKGVAGEVRPWQDMPVDANGNRAEVMALCTSVGNRMNPGLIHEMMVGAAGRDVIKRIRRALDLPDMGVIPWDIINDTVYRTSNLAVCDEQFEYLMGFYKLVAPNENYKALSKPSVKSTDRWLKHLAQVIKDGDEPYGLYINLPSNSGVRMAEVMAALENGPYRPEITCVTYRDHAGKMVTTRKPILIGPSYFLILEKTATDWSGVSSSKVSHFGTTARLTNADKYSSPGRQTVTRTLDESSIRNVSHATGAEILADIADLNNNPITHAEACTTVLTHETPTNIERVVDRTKFKLGGARPLAFALHQLAVSGKNISRE